MNEFLNNPSPPESSYGSWKTWEGMEFKNFVFQAWKVMENCINGRLINHIAVVKASMK